MKKEAIDFYKENDIPISLLIDKRRHNTTPEQVEAAAISTYEEIQGGLCLNRSEMPRYIFRKAIGIKAEQYKKERIKIQNYDKKVRLLARAYKKTKQELKILKSSVEAKEIRNNKILLYVTWGMLALYGFLKAIGLPL